MNKVLEELVKISSLDKEIDLMEPKITQIRKELIEKEKEKEKKENIILDLNEEKQDYALLLQKSEETLKNANAKLEEIAKKISEIRTDKELKALNIEEEIAREQITFQNSEIQRIEKLILSHDEKIQTLEEENIQIQNKMEEIEQNISSAIEDLKKEQTEISKKKTALISKMDQKVVAFYEKVRKWAKGTSVVPLYKQACGGCFIRLNDRAYAEVLRGETITTCPNCGRILFVEEE